jgi:hypothetical protein
MGRTYRVEMFSDEESYFIKRFIEITDEIQKSENMILTINGKEGVSPSLWIQNQVLQFQQWT